MLMLNPGLDTIDKALPFSEIGKVTLVPLKRFEKSSRTAIWPTDQAVN